MHVTTLKYRLKDNQTNRLAVLAKKVNYVWNYCNALQQKHFRGSPHLKWSERCVSFFDFTSKYLGGTSKLLKLPQHSVESVAAKYVDSRKTHNKAWLKFRNGAKLPWVPFRSGQIKNLIFDSEGSPVSFIFNKVNYRIMPGHKRAFPEGWRILDGGNFSQDKQGHWYINIVVEYEPAKHYHQSNNTAGIDLGLKTLGALSNGRKIPNKRHYEKEGKKIARLQKLAKREIYFKEDAAGNMVKRSGGITSKKINKQIGRLAAKVQRRRNHDQHVETKRIADAFPAIKVGNVSSQWLLQSNSAKAVSDAGWYGFKQKLRYKSVRNGGEFYEVNEAHSTQICSNCGGKPDSRPKGIADLGIRKWQCSDCGSVNDRDVNAAINISRAVPGAPAVGAASLRATKTRSGGRRKNGHSKPNFDSSTTVFNSGICSEAAIQGVCEQVSCGG